MTICRACQDLQFVIRAPKLPSRIEFTVCGDQMPGEERALADLQEVIQGRKREHWRRFGNQAAFNVPQNHPKVQCEKSGDQSFWNLIAKMIWFKSLSMK